MEIKRPFSLLGCTATTCHKCQKSARISRVQRTYLAKVDGTLGLSIALLEVLEHVMRVEHELAPLPIAHFESLLGQITLLQHAAARFHVCQCTLQGVAQSCVQLVR